MGKGIDLDPQTAARADSSVVEKILWVNGRRQLPPI